MHLHSSGQSAAGPPPDTRKDGTAIFKLLANLWFSVTNPILCLLAFIWSASDRGLVGKTTVPTSRGRCSTGTYGRALHIFFVVCLLVECVAATQGVVVGDGRFGVAGLTASRLAEGGARNGVPHRLGDDTSARKFEAAGSDPTGRLAPRAAVNPHSRQLEDVVGCATLILMDIYGDGWTGGAALSFTSVATGDTFMSGLTLFYG